MIRRGLRILMASSNATNIEDIYLGSALRLRHYLVSVFMSDHYLMRLCITWHVAAVYIIGTERKMILYSKCKYLFIDEYKQENHFEYLLSTFNK